jgi:hypothetical protein
MGIGDFRESASLTMLPNVLQYQGKEKTKMVFTQYGVPVDRVIHVDIKTGMAEVELVNPKGQTETRLYYLNQLRADGGINEIISAARSVKN